MSNPDRDAVLQGLADYALQEYARRMAEMDPAPQTTELIQVNNSLAEINRELADFGYKLVAMDRAAHIIVEPGYKSRIEIYIVALHESGPLNTERPLLTIDIPEPEIDSPHPPLYGVDDMWRRFEEVTNLKQK